MWLVQYEIGAYRIATIPCWISRIYNLANLSHRSRRQPKWTSPRERKFTKPALVISKEKSTMTQAASNSHNVPNFMMCRHEHENLLNAVSSMELMHGLSWSTAQIGGGVQETPPTQQNRNEIFKFWFIIKMAKISTQASITWVACSLVLDWWRARRQVELRWRLIQRADTHLQRKTERTFVNCETMITVQSCKRRNSPVPFLGWFQWTLLRNRRARDFI